MSVSDVSAALEERFQEPAVLCRGCGTLLIGGQDCPRCGPQPELSDADGFRLSVNLSILRCDRCRAVMSCDAVACPACGDPASPVEPREAPTNRAKLEALGDLLPQFQQLAAAPDGDAPPAALTDQQVIAYLRRNAIVSEGLIADRKATARAIDLSSEGAIRSPETRQAWERLLGHMRATRRVYDEIRGVRAPEQFDPARRLLLAAYRALLDFDLAIADSVLALTREALQAAGRRLLTALDRAAEALHALAAAIDQVDPALVETTVGGRLALFAGRPGRYEHEARPDFAAVLQEGLAQAGASTSLGLAGAARFAGMLTVDPAALAPETGLVLYLLAAELAAAEDPLSVRRRAHVMLELLDDAWQRDRAAVAALLVDAEADVERALVFLLSLADQFRVLRPDSLPREAQRLTLAQAYGTLTEGVFARLVTMVLGAKFILGGRAEPYAETAARGLGDKVHALSQAATADERYAAALLGVATIARNAGAHGGIDLSGELIRLRDRNPRTGVVREEELSDGAFADRLLDLLLTCHALRLAIELFRVDRAAALPPAPPPRTPRIVSESARAIVGLWGLSAADVRVGGRADPVVVTAAAAREARRGPSDFLVAAATLATLFRDWPSLQLRVARAAEATCRVTVPTAVAVAVLDAPEDGREYLALRLAYLAEIEPGALPPAARYERAFLKPAARLVAQRLAELGRLRQALPASVGEYLAAVDRALSGLDTLREVAPTVPPPPAALARRRHLLESLALVRRGLAKHRTLLEAGRWAEIRRQSGLLQRGERGIEQLIA